MHVVMQDVQNVAEFIAKMTHWVLLTAALKQFGTIQLIVVTMELQLRAISRRIHAPSLEEL